MHKQLQSAWSKPLLWSPDPPAESWACALLLQAPHRGGHRITALARVLVQGARRRLEQEGPGDFKEFFGCLAGHSHPVLTPPPACVFGSLPKKALGCFSGSEPSFLMESSRDNGQ